MTIQANIVKHPTASITFHLQLYRDKEKNFRSTTYSILTEKSFVSFFIVKELLQHNNTRWHENKGKRYKKNAAFFLFKFHMQSVNTFT